MKRRHSLWLLCGCGLFLASCDRRADSPQAAKPAPTAEIPASAPEIVSPMLLDSYSKHDLQPGIQIHAWNIRAHNLKELTTSLLVIRDGEPQTASKIEYRWETWDNSQPQAVGQILLLMQDGESFGVKDKRLPLLSVDFPKLSGGTGTRTTTNITIDGDLKPTVSSVSTAGSLSGSPPVIRKAILYTELFVPVKDLVNSNFILSNDLDIAENVGRSIEPGVNSNFSLSNDLDQLTKAASSGRIVVAIVLEWVVNNPVK